MPNARALLRAGELTSVWVPDPVHERCEIWCAARSVAFHDARKARTLVQLFSVEARSALAGQVLDLQTSTWLRNRQFSHQAQQIAFKATSIAWEQA